MLKSTGDKCKDESLYYEMCGSFLELILRKLASNCDESSGLPFGIPATWEWSTIKDEVTFAKNRNIEKELAPEELINYVDIDAVDNKRFTIREAKKRTVRELSSRARRVLTKGSIIYSLVRPYLNNVAIVDYDLQNHIGSTGFAVFTPNRIHPKFFVLLLLTEYVRKRFVKLQSGFNSPGISQSQFELTPIPVLPKSIQQSILQFLGSIETQSYSAGSVFFDKIVEEEIVRLYNAKVSATLFKDVLGQQQSYLQLLRQTILQEAVQGKLTKQDERDESASELLKRIKAEKQKLVKEGKLKKEKELPPIMEEEIPFTLPKGWVWCRLGKVTTLITDGKHGDSPNQTSSGYYFLSAKDIKDDKLTYEFARQITYEGFLETHRRTDLKPGDICLVNTGATIGKIAIAEDNELTYKTTFQKSVAVIKVLQQFVSINYAEMFLRGSVSHLVKTSGGSAINNLLLGDLRHLLFPLPPLAEQQRIVSKVQQLQQQCSELEAQVRQSQQYAQKLLQAVLKEAFGGKEIQYEVNNELSLAAEN